MLALDYVGLGALIGSMCAGIVSIIVALRQTPQIAKLEDVHAAVSTSNGHTIGELVEKNEARHEAEETTPEVAP